MEVLSLCILVIVVVDLSLEKERERAVVGVPYRSQIFSMIRICYFVLLWRYLYIQKCLKLSSYKLDQLNARRSLLHYLWVAYMRVLPKILSSFLCPYPLTLVFQLIWPSASILRTLKSCEVQLLIAFFVNFSLVKKKLFLSSVARE